jgi:hypothetical protein
MDPRSQMNRRQFFSEQNEAMLYGMIAKNFQQRLGSSLSQSQSTFLENSLERWMSEFFQENPGLPVQELNKGVISATASDFKSYLQRKEALASATPEMFQETAQRYEQIQMNRQRSLEAPRPAVPEYVQAVQIKEDESTTALELFEEAKKRRNMEMNAQAQTQVANRAASALQPIYLQDVERPDMRAIYDKPLDMVIAGQQSRELPGRGDINPTIVRPGPDVAPRGTLQQDLIIRQEDIQSYKETEYNLSVYSADRKWEIDTNNNENRFNFTVNFYSINQTNGVSIMPRGVSRLKNIVRIEFVKAVVPIDVTQMVVRKTLNSNSQYVYDTNYVKTLYEFPYITLNVDELDTNTYGTSNSMDNAFGVLQYDSNWTDNTDSMGYTSLIPKHMKCQRLYSPTPLATLNKLSIRLQQPNGSIVNQTADTVDVSGVFISQRNYVSDYLPGTLVTTSTGYTDTHGEYIWIDLNKWFSRYQISTGDRIVIRNLTVPISQVPLWNPVNAQNAYNTDFLNFVQNPNGHIVVGTAYATDISGTVTLIDGTNNVGYSRFIIIRSQFQDPTTGSSDVLPFGGSAYTAVGTPVTGQYISGPGKLINMSRQTQFIFRVITREYDPTSIVRPDNL